MTRLSLAVWVVTAAACGLPAKEATPSSPRETGNLPVPASCTCYFEQWSLRASCGSWCLGDAKLFCSATAASVDPDGCAATRPDAGVGSDAGLPPALDAGQPDAGAEGCTLSSETCGCTIAPYGPDDFRLTIPCCTIVCFTSRNDYAFACSATGVTELAGIPAVCRQ